MNGRFRGKTVIVTGGASGIGRAASQRFAAEGAFVVIADIQEAAGRRVATEIGRERALFALTDLADPASIASCIETVVAARGDIHCLVNNAAIFDPTPDTEAVEAGTARRLFDILLLAPMLMSRHCIPHLKRTQGSIVSTTSVTGIAPSGTSAVYGPLKAALTHWIRCAALELAPHHVRVNGVCPGGVLTPLIMPAMGLDGSDLERVDATRAAMAHAQPLPKAGEPDDIAAAMLFLASEEAGWITGQNLVVDGGWSLAPGRAAG